MFKECLSVVVPSKTYPQMRIGCTGRGYRNGLRGQSSRGGTEVGNRFMLSLLEFCEMEKGG